MLSVSLLSPTSELPPTPKSILYTARRSAILPYSSDLLSTTRTLLHLPLYLLGLSAESSTISVPMAESISFAKGRPNIPAAVWLEVQSKAGQNIEIYDASLRIVARLEGLRWWMYNWRFLSALVGVSTFWGAEVIFAAVGWLVLRVFMSSDSTMAIIKSEGIKAENEVSEFDVKNDEIQDDLDLSDTPRSFPTYGRQPPLQYVPRVKEEEIESEEIMEGERDGVRVVAEADDESEEVGGSWVEGRQGEDSGIGTSLSEGGSGVWKARRRKGSARHG